MANVYAPTGSYNQTWVAWNSSTTTATSNIGAYDSQWVFRQSTGSYTNSTVSEWLQWNSQYYDMRETRKQTAAELQASERAADVRWLISQARWQGAAGVALDVSALGKRGGSRLKGELVLTDEELHEVQDAWQRASEEQAERVRREAEVAAVKAAASARAEKLLVSMLTAAQKREWLEHKRVTEVAPSGRVWRLFPQWAGGAAIMDGEARRATLCVHPVTRVPEEDSMAGILATLRSGGEEKLIGVAVKHTGVWSEEELAIRAVERRVA